eukprot:5511719-Prymnesium_polylepis.1
MPTSTAPTGALAAPSVATPLEAHSLQHPCTGSRPVAATRSPSRRGGSFCIESLLDTLTAGCVTKAGRAGRKMLDASV